MAMARPSDAAKLQTAGDAVPIGEQVDLRSRAKMVRV
jgi:hypothetical protein